ncbi:dolichol-phosphate mannosyltransferase [Microbacterium sp. CH12i]|uniref:polyprenol monophosphomannose synthase n=1 Tax=Microbacterium sp. CH12i TaxID=1479651 RepID=UPI000460B22D|nr:polyprenol monophosphomannose synthase [Microbacterium sp. CH12i]KDA04995.1 dolichol-phosphate mannosyltransferase [Microbacterium sp. CH12i]
MSARTVVILPTYNESENLESMVSRIRRTTPDVCILVVDDNSPDGTGELAQALALGDPLLQVMHRREKDGLGAAYLAGFDWAMRQGFDVVVECDADGSHHPEELPRLLEAIHSADVAIGSRWVEGGAVVNWPWHRRLLSRAGSGYARLMLRVPQRDMTSGYRAYRATALEQLKGNCLGADPDATPSRCRRGGDKPCLSYGPIG